MSLGSRFVHGQSIVIPATYIATCLHIATCLVPVSVWVNTGAQLQGRKTVGPMGLSWQCSQPCDCPWSLLQFFNHMIELQHMHPGAAYALHSSIAHFCCVQHQHNMLTWGPCSICMLARASTRGRIDAFTRLLECTCPTCLPLCCQLTTPRLPQITLVHLPWLSSASDQSCRIVYCTGDEHNVGQPGSVIKCHPVPRSDCWSAATECAGSACHHLEQHPASSKIDSDPRAAGACL